MSKYAIWTEIPNDGNEFDVLFQFDEEGNFQDITPEGKAVLEENGITDFPEWLGGIDYPVRWEEYQIRSEPKGALL